MNSLENKSNYAKRQFNHLHSIGKAFSFVLFSLLFFTANSILFAQTTKDVEFDIPKTDSIAESDNQYNARSERALLAQQTAKLIAPDGAANDRLGICNQSGGTNVNVPGDNNSAAISGDTAVVGAVFTNGGKGAAYVFVKTGITWAFQAKLTATDGLTNDRFGCSVAISGNTILIGSIGLNQPTGGAGYVFVRNGATWTQQAKLTVPAATAGRNFGGIVALDGNTAVIAEQGSPTSTNTGGVVYVYVRTGTTWATQANLFAQDGTVNDEFGSSVAISGDTLAIGARFQNLNNSSNSPDHGAVYIYVRGGATWILQRKITAADSMNNDRFGSSVALSGNTVLIGSRFYDTTVNPVNNGSVYVYTRTDTTWTFQTKLTASDGDAGDYFGFSIALEGDTAVIGARFDDVGSNTNQGSAYIFTRSGSNWTQQEKLLASDGAAIDDFGSSVDISGNTIVAVASGNDIDNLNDRGSMYVFDNTPVPPGRTRFDFDGDGKADLGVFRPSNGGWYIYNLANGTNQSYAFGASTDKITPTDYDGDGKTDVAVFRNGTWYLQRSSLGFTGIGFGAADDVPVPADYDGDGKADIAVFRPSIGAWYLLQSTLGFTGVTFGQTGDKPVAADYDGDGKADIAVYRAGIWYIQRSQLGFTGIAFGDAADKPVPADYDGDGKTDVAVFRDGTWYLNRSQAGFTGVAFGAAGDKPVPNAFVP